jgi:DNA-binding CsgD family transcriptional regulator
MSTISGATRITTNHNFDDHSGVESSSAICTGLALAVKGAEVPECVGSYGTMELALAELGKLMAVQSPLEVLLIGIGLAGNSGAEGRPLKTPPPSPKAACRVIQLFRTVHPPAPAGYDLSPHEIRVLKLLVEGHNYKTAAIELGVSVNTVSFHVRRIYEKLQVHSKSEAVAKALKNHLV